MKTRWLIALLLGLCVVAHADRDIVYAARYYTPPASHRTSHFHIYRINPDGTGKTQLTFGIQDDYGPKWSANGKYITFYTDKHVNDNFIGSKFCAVSADGGKRRVLKTATKPADNPIPAQAFGYSLEYTDRQFLLDMKTGKRLLLRVDDGPTPELLPGPGHQLIYGYNNHSSTVPTDYLYYWIDLSTGVLRYMTEGQFLAWAPDGLHFCTAPGRDTTPYEKRKEPYPVQYFGQTDARYRSVWFAPLYVRAAAGGPMKQITPRLSYVTGADWRKVK